MHFRLKVIKLCGFVIFLPAVTVLWGFGSALGVAVSPLRGSVEWLEKGGVCLLSFSAGCWCSDDVVTTGGTTVWVWKRVEKRHHKQQIKEIYLTWQILEENIISKPVPAIIWAFLCQCSESQNQNHQWFHGCPALAANCLMLCHHDASFPLSCQGFWWAPAPGKRSKNRKMLNIWVTWHLTNHTHFYILTCVMTPVLLSISSTSGFVCKSCWIWGLDWMSCLASWGLELERVFWTKGLFRRRHIISGSASNWLSIWRWRAGKKPGPLFVRPRLSRPSTVETGKKKSRNYCDWKCKCDARKSTK